MKTAELTLENHKRWEGNQVFSFIERALLKLEPHLSHDDITEIDQKIALFKQQLSNNIEQIAFDYLELYSERSDALRVFNDTIMMALKYWLARSDSLIQRDMEKQSIGDFYNSHKMIGASCYIDLFAGNIMGMVSKIDYFKSLGITYLYILPLSLIHISEPTRPY